jgi:hypothetical protein
MKQVLMILHVFLFCMTSFSGKSQSHENVDSLIIGTWKGTSICQVKNSPCHDETVVYHVTKHNTNSYEFNANKIVNGLEEEMGIITFSFDNKTKELHSNQYKGIWTFKLSQGKIDGTLYFNGSLYRIITVMKMNP